jgi:hypothetical protein
LFSESKGKVVPAALGIVRNAEIQGQISKVSHDLGGAIRTTVKLIYWLSSDQAIKLTERAIQYADTAAHTRRALSERCRLALVEGEDGDVETYSGKLRADPIPDAVAEIVRAQVFIKSGELRLRLLRKILLMPWYGIHRHGFLPRSLKRCRYRCQ